VCEFPVGLGRNHNLVLNFRTDKWVSRLRWSAKGPPFPLSIWCYRLVEDFKANSCTLVYLVSEIQPSRCFKQRISPILSENFWHMLKPRPKCVVSVYPYTQARSYIQARGGSCLLVSRRLNYFETQINVMRNCVKRKKIWQKESYKPVAVAVRLRSTPYVVTCNIFVLHCSWRIPCSWIWDQTVTRSAHRTPLSDDFGPDLPLLFKLHEIWLVAFLENRQNCCQQISGCTKFDFGWGSAPDPVAGFNGAYFSANLFTVDSRRVVPAH